MAFFFPHLDGRLRTEMLRELSADIAEGRAYYSPRLKPESHEDWLDILAQAFSKHDEVWLGLAVRARGLLKKREMRKLEDREVSSRVPTNAAFLLAEGEFNRYYIRGLCRQVMQEGGAQVEICRGKEVEIPRASSEQRIGSRIEAQELLRALEESPELPSPIKVPSGPGSGLTVKKVG
jgi:hypothetical protein